MPAVRYEFVATGGDAVAAQFRSIRDEALSSSKAAADAGRAFDRALGARRRGGGGAGGSPAEGGGGSPYRRSGRSPSDGEERAAKRAADAQIREAERAQRHVAGIRDRYFANEQRQEERAAAARTRASKRLADERARDMGRLAKDTGLAAVGAGASLLGVVGTAARESMQLEAIANRVSINARGAGQAGVESSTLRKEFQAAAIATPGIKAADIGEATQKYVDLTGDLQTARDNMQSFATVASATGAQVQDVATAAASLGSKFDVKNVGEMRKVMAMLAFQGKGGALTLKDLAGQFQKLAAAGAAFGLGKGPEAVSKLGGLMQIARQGTKSPTSAGTAVENIFSALTQKSGQLKHAGVDVYGKNGEKRDIDEVLAETISKVGGSNVEKKNADLAKLFGKQGIRAMNPLIATYSDAARGKSGADAQKAGYEAVLAALHKASSATSDWAEIEKDAAQAQQDSSAKVDAAWESIKAKVGDEVLPALSTLIPKLSALATEGIDPAITVFTALVEAGNLAIDVLKELGLFSPKKKAPAEELAKAKKDLAEYQNKLDNRNHLLTGDEVKEKRRLEAAVAAADAAAYTTMPKGGGALSKEEFAAKYADLSGEDYGTEGRKADAVFKAKQLADRIANEPGMRDPGNENEAQKNFRLDYGAQQRQQTAADQSAVQNGQSIGDMTDVNVQLRHLAATAAILDGALRKAAEAGAPSIVAGG